MTERNFQKLVIKELKEKHNAYVINVEGLAIGLPDLIACYNGTFLGIELKVGNKYKATPAQLLQIKKINERGGLGFVFTHSDSWREELKKIISTI